MIVYIAAALCIIVVVYLLVTYVQAKSHIDTAPKTEMFLCPKHGAMPMAATMDINPQELEFEMEFGAVTTGRIPYCPRCYEDRIKEADAKHGDFPNEKES